MATILVVDDNEINRRILTKLLSRHKHQLQEAVDGSDALKKVSVAVPDLIITDMLMPVMDGHELIRQLRAKPATATVPIIIYSTLYLARSAQSFVQTYGVSNIITKPSKPEAIIKAVNTALGLPFKDEDPLEAANQRVEMLLGIGRQLASEQTPHYLLENFCERVRKLNGAKCAFLGILEESLQELHLFFASGIEVQVARERLLPITQEILNQVRAERVPLRARGEEIAPQPTGSPALTDRFECLLAVPIATSTRFYGWLCLIDKLGDKEFGEEDERLNSTLATQVGSTYENLIRYTSLQCKVEQFAQKEIDPTNRASNDEEIEQRIKQLETQLKERTAQLESASREHEAFSHFVAHDLRKPLRLIADQSQLLATDHLTKNDKEGHQLVQRIYTGATLTEKIITDLLLLSQFGRKELERTTIDLENLAQTVAGELQKLEPSHNVTVTVQALPPVSADLAMIKQILNNLIENAFKFTRDCPQPAIKIGFRQENGETVYYVKDNGVGFNMQYADKLFNALQRQRRVEEFEGKGTGLAIVKRAIERHGGRVWAESLGTGATFYFTIPGTQPD